MHNRHCVFPVVFLYGVSQYLFTALALTVVLTLAGSYFFAMTVIPLFCAKFIKNTGHQVGHRPGATVYQRVLRGFNRGYDSMLLHYDRAVRSSLQRPWFTIMGVFTLILSGALTLPFLGFSFFPRSDPGQFVINVKAPSGTRLEVTDQYIAQVEDEVRQVIPKDELGIIVSNIGITPDFSAMYTPNSGQHTAFVQVSLSKEHRGSSFFYMDAVRKNSAHRCLNSAHTFKPADWLMPSSTWVCLRR